MTQPFAGEEQTTKDVDLGSLTLMYPNPDGTHVAFYVLNR